MTGVSKGAKVWVALWVVYIVWGSTYLGIELASETMPGIFAAGIRFTIAGLLMLAFLAWRHGLPSLRVSRAALAACALVGLLLPGANSILFITERKVPIGLTSLIIASVPLWVLLLRLSVRERPDLVSTIGLVVGFGGIVLLVQPGSDTGPLGYLLLTVLAAFMNVCRGPAGRMRTATISSSGSRAFCFGPSRKSVSGRVRSPPVLRSTSSASATRRGGRASPAGEAVPRLPPMVPRFRICGLPTVREASASAGAASASGASIASV